MGIARERVLTKASLSAQDCLFMGKHCFNSGALARSLEWFEEAWVMAGSERNQSSLRQDQVQQFLDHAAKAHDVRVLNGERGPELFPKPVYDESPFDQRTKMVQETKERFKENITSLGKQFTNFGAKIQIVFQIIIGRNFQAKMNNFHLFLP